MKKSRSAPVAVMDETYTAKAKERPLPRSPLLEWDTYAIARLEG